MFRHETNPVLILAAFLMIVLLAPALMPLASLASAQTIEPVRHNRVSLPPVSADQKQQFASLALSMPELKKWSSSEWKVASIGYLGVTEPVPRITHAIVDLVLPKNAVTPKACSLGWGASVKINVDTMQIEQASVPTAASECGVEFGGPVVSAPSGPEVVPSPNPKVIATPQVTSAPSETFGAVLQSLDWVSQMVSNFLLPHAYAVVQSSGYSTAVDNTAVDSFWQPKIYGNYVEMASPSITGSCCPPSGIYLNMDHHVSMTLNDYFGCPTCLLQSGWVVTSEDLGPQSGIPQYSKAYFYTDGYAFGNLRAHNTYLTYVDGSTLYVETYCYGTGYYQQDIVIGGHLYSRLTGRTCTSLANPPENNSVFVENPNTGIYATAWVPYITSPVTATNANHFTSLTNGYSSGYTAWPSSDNRDSDCFGPHTPNANSVITGSLANHGIAKWQRLGSIPSYCSHDGGGLAVVSRSLSTNSYIDGLHAVVYDPSGNLIASGYTPLYVSALTAGTYNVDYSNYGNYYYTRTYPGISNFVTNWGGGRVSVYDSTSGISIVTGLYYDNGNPGSNAKVEYRAQTSGGALTGMWVASKDSSGNVLSQGYTPYTVGTPINTVGNPSQDVTVIWSNYGTHNIYSATTNANQQSLVIAPPPSWGATQTIRPINSGGGSSYYDQGNFS
jgi:hypothetical protein